MYSEYELIAGCKKEIPEFQKFLYEKYGPAMLVLSLRYTGNIDEARDVLHDGFIKVLSQFKTYRQETPLEYWISKIIINTAIDYITNVHKKIIFKDMNKYDKIEDEITIDNDESYLELDPEIVLNKIQNLSTGYRTILNLHAFENYTHKQIATLLGIKEGTVKSQLAKARKRLKEMLAENIKVERP